MPELPEVEIIKNQLQEKLTNKTITSVEVYWKKTISNMSENEFIKKVSNQKIIKLSRKGKFLIFHLINGCIVIHLRMSGKLFFIKDASYASKYQRVKIVLSNGSFLSFDDVRKFGKMYYFSNFSFLENIGIDALDKGLDESILFEMTQKTKKNIKAFLLDQKKISGVGNIYADEALYMAKISPKRKSDSISRKEIKSLIRAVKTVLLKGIENGGTSLGDSKSNYLSSENKKGKNQSHLQVYGKKDCACDCGAKILKIKLAQRGTYYCASCQN
jgi:formamidopyrimidine-DNA glycosylase